MSKKPYKVGGAIEGAAHIPFGMFLHTARFSLPTTGRAAGFDSERHIRNWCVRGLIGRRRPKVALNDQHWFSTDEVVQLAVARRLVDFGVKISKANKIARECAPAGRFGIADRDVCLTFADGQLVQASPDDLTAETVLLLRTSLVRNKVRIHLLQIWESSPFAVAPA